ATCNPLVFGQCRFLDWYHLRGARQNFRSRVSRLGRRAILQSFVFRRWIRHLAPCPILRHSQLQHPIAGRLTGRSRMAWRVATLSKTRPVTVENLLRETWANLDPQELRSLLRERIGGPGQLDGDTNKFYLPLAREAC